MLHGDMKINECDIAHWYAAHMYPIGNGFVRYECVVKYRSEKGYPMIAEFELDHEVGLGALVLTSEVMLECEKHMRIDYGGN